MNIPSLVLGVAIFVSAAVAEEKYTTKYDHINLEEILNNERLLKKYIECMLANTDSNCTPEGKDLRFAVPDALTNDCSRCSEKQKEGAKTVILFLKTKKEEAYQKLLAKYDPDGTYREAYETKYLSS